MLIATALYNNRYNQTVSVLIVNKRGLCQMHQRNFEHLAAPLWLLFGGRNLLVGKTLELLREIDSKGSLSKAADAIPISYKNAWDMIDRLNNLSTRPVVVTTTGGRNEGGMLLHAAFNSSQVILALPM